MRTPTRTTLGYFNLFVAFFCFGAALVPPYGISTAMLAALSVTNLVMWWKR